MEITPSTIENNGQREQRGQREQKGQMEQRGLSGTGSVLSGERGDSTLYTQLTHQQKIQKFISQKENRNKNSLTPRSRSKFEHLIKNLRECNEDEQLVLYKVLESPPLSNNLKISEAVPYKGEPKVNFLRRVCRALDIYRLFKKKCGRVSFLYIGFRLDFDRCIVLYRINTVWSFSGISELLIMSAPATVGSVTNNGDVARTEYLIFSPE